MTSVIKGRSKLMSEPAPEPEPKLFESRSQSGNKKFRLHNTALMINVMLFGRIGDGYCIEALPICEMCGQATEALVTYCKIDSANDFELFRTGKDTLLDELSKRQCFKCEFI